MALFRKLGAVAAAVLLVASIAGAQEERPRAYVGSEDLGLEDMNSGGAPATLVISDLADIDDYAFDGSDLSIPFTLDGTQTGSATVWLIVYTSGQNPPLTITGVGPSPGGYDAEADRGTDGNYAAAGWHVYQNVDTQVYRSAGEQFDAGANEIVWNGRDNNGDVVEAGSYDLFLAAFDADARPHIVGYAPGRGGSQHLLLVDPDAGTLTRPFDWVVDMNNDFITNPDAATYIDRSEIQAESPSSGDDISESTGLSWWTDTDRAQPIQVNDLTPLGTSGNVTEDLKTWIGNYYGQGQIFKGSYDPATMVATVDTDWGADHGAVNGFIDYSALQGQRRYSVASHGGKAYTTNGMNSPLGDIAVWDVATGENVDYWDVSEIFQFANGGRVGGPSYTTRDYAGKSDPTGLTASSHFISAIASFDWETGDIRWINRNGDGFADMYSPNPTGGVNLTYGNTSGAGGKYGFNSSKWGWTSVSHTAVNYSDYGSVLGGDGSGLFKIQPTNMPSSIPWWTMIVDHNDSDWDGLYISVGEDDPNYRSNDWAPPKPEDAIIDYYSYHWFTQLPYDQKRVSLGDAQTAVAELGGTTPDRAELGDAYPNPFNPETTIRFNLPWEAPVKVEVFNDQGQLVTTLVNDLMGPGNFSVTWDGRDANGSEVASGVYLYKIESADLRLSKKVTFVK